MEQRRKIVIPTGADGEETLSTPHFDAEATLAARPVVPLAGAAPEPGTAYAAASRGDAARPRAAATASSSWKRSTLALIVLGAVSIGVASGLAIGFYQSNRKTTAAASAPVVAPPGVSEQPQQQAAVPPQPAPSQAERVEQPQLEPETEASIPDAPAEKVEKESAAARNRADDDDDERSDDKPSARDNRKRDEERRNRDEERAQPPVMRERRTTVPIFDERDEEDEDARRAERRERRREERRDERRRRREDDDDGGPVRVPRNVERARQEINRIRDIFEGRQP